MNAFADEVRIMIDALKKAKATIATIDNPAIILLTGKVKSDLTRHINSLSVQIGEAVEDTEFNRIPAPPITKILGRDVTTGRKDAAASPVVHKSPDEVALDDLRTQVDEIYPKFLEAPADDILDSLPDLVIRGVAKRAGLVVAENVPERLTTPYVEEIKEAIRRQRKNDEFVNAGSGANDDTTGGGTGEGDDEKTFEEQLKALEQQLTQLTEEKAHHMKIKAVEKQIADLKAAHAPNS